RSRRRGRASANRIDTNFFRRPLRTACQFERSAVLSNAARSKKAVKSSLVKPSARRSSRPDSSILKYATPLRAARMAEKKSRAAARKIKDKWKAKVWYNLLAPEMFNKQLLGETPTDTPDKLVGRVTE